MPIKVFDVTDNTSRALFEGYEYGMTVKLIDAAINQFRDEHGFTGSGAANDHGRPVLRNPAHSNVFQALDAGGTLFGTY